MCSKEPQIILVRGKEEVVVLSKRDYKQLVGAKPALVDFMNQSPLKNLPLDLRRDTSVEC